MGTVVSIDVRDAEPRDDLVAELVAWLHEVDATFSTYRPDSAINRLDRGVLALGDVEDDVRFVLERCDALRVQTGGYFDARATGRLDPSALVKGWAVQRGVDRLVAAGVRDVCVNAGGDVATRGCPPPAREWRIGIVHPLERDALAAVVEGTDLAVATSGTYERGRHIVDPSRGEAPDGVLSVTVTGPDLGTADAYATAAFAMGVEGPAWTMSLDGYEAMTILADESVLCTPGFPER